MSFNKREQNKKRQVRIRRRFSGSAERPRLSVFRSNKHLYAQLINDEEGKTIVSSSTQSKAVKEKMPYGGNVKVAEVVGTMLAEDAKKEKITKVVFDRAGRKYHGRIKALADAARKGGLEF